METRSEKMIRSIAELMERGKVWYKYGRYRVYLPSRKDIDLYLDFPDATSEYLGGCVIQCTIRDCGQHPNWYESQKAIARLSARAAFNLATWYTYTENAKEATAIFEGEVTLTDEAIGHLINGRIDEARSIIGLLTDKEKEML